MIAVVTLATRRGVPTTINIYRRPSGDRVFSTVSERKGPEQGRNDIAEGMDEEEGKEEDRKLDSLERLSCFVWIE